VDALLASPGQIGLIVLRTLVVYAFILVGFRLTGKRDLGQLGPFDLALILLIANAVQNAMVGPDTSLVGGLVAAGALLLANHGFGLAAARSRRFERALQGRAKLLIYRGKAHPEALATERISHDDLLQALREHGCSTVEQCRLAVLEVDGTISVVPQAPDGSKA
jgi:uncharacterized membrane protein YcaP (DUF421 family)